MLKHVGINRWYINIFCVVVHFCTLAMESGGLPNTGVPEHKVMSLTTMWLLKIAWSLWSEYTCTFAFGFPVFGNKYPNSLVQSVVPSCKTSL